MAVAAAVVVLLDLLRCCFGQWLGQLSKADLSHFYWSHQKERLLCCCMSLWHSSMTTTRVKGAFFFQPYQQQQLQETRCCLYVYKVCSSPGELRRGLSHTQTARGSSSSSRRLPFALPSLLIEVERQVGNIHRHCVWKLWQYSYFCRYEPTLILEPF